MVFRFLATNWRRWLFLWHPPCFKTLLRTTFSFLEIPARNFVFTTVPDLTHSFKYDLACHAAPWLPWKKIPKFLGKRSVCWLFPPAWFRVIPIDARHIFSIDQYQYFVKNWCSMLALRCAANSMLNDTEFHRSACGERKLAWYMWNCRWVAAIPLLFLWFLGFLMRSTCCLVVNACFRSLLPGIATTRSTTCERQTSAGEGKPAVQTRGWENFLWNLPDEPFLIILLGILHWHEWKKEGQFEDGHVNSNQEKARESLDKVAGCEAMLKHVYNLQGRLFCLYMLMAMAAMSSNICVCTRPGNMMKLPDCDWVRGQVHQVHRPCMFCFDDVSFCWVDSLEPCKT